MFALETEIRVLNKSNLSIFTVFYVLNICLKWSSLLCGINASATDKEFNQNCFKTEKNISGNALFGIPVCNSTRTAINHAKI